MSLIVVWLSVNSEPDCRVWMVNWWVTVADRLQLAWWLICVARHLDGGVGGGGICGNRVAYVRTRAQTPTWSAGDTPTLTVRVCDVSHGLCLFVEGQQSLEGQGPMLGRINHGEVSFWVRSKILFWIKNKYFTLHHFWQLFTHMLLTVRSVCACWGWQVGCL